MTSAAWLIVAGIMAGFGIGRVYSFRRGYLLGLRHMAEETQRAFTEPPARAAIRDALVKLEGEARR